MIKGRELHPRVPDSPALETLVIENFPTQPITNSRKVQKLWTTNLMDQEHQDQRNQEFEKAVVKENPEQPREDKLSHTPYSNSRGLIRL